MPNKPIGQSMVEAKLINNLQLDQLLEYQRTSSDRIPLGRLSVTLGFVREEEFAPFLASYFSVPFINLDQYSAVQKEAIESIPESIARRFNVLPLVKVDDTLTIAMADPLDLTTLDNLQAVTRCRIKRVVSPANQIKRSIKTHYSGIVLTRNGIRSKDGLPVISLERYRKGWPLAPSLIKLIIERATKDAVTMIHIQPEENRLKIFFRVDKKLEKIASYPKGVFQSVVTYIKNAAKLNFNASDIPQSGYFTFSNDKLNIEVGVSIFPTLAGERIVLEVPRRMGWLDDVGWSSRPRKQIKN